MQVGSKEWEQMKSWSLRAALAVKKFIHNQERQLTRTVLCPGTPLALQEGCAG